MNSLPVELLMHIFKYVPSNDRRNSIRLVCRQWNDIAEDQIFTRDEIIIIPNYEYTKILTCLQKSQRGAFNLHFMDLVIDEVEIDHAFWRSNGRLVRSLVFNDSCRLTLPLFQGIISQCPHVKHVSLNVYNLEKHCKWMPHPHTDVNFTAESVSSFFCYLNKSPETMVYDIIGSTLSSFPNLDELKIYVSNCFKGGLHQHLFPFDIYSLIPEWSGESFLRVIADFIQSSKMNLKKLSLIEGGNSRCIYKTSVNFPDAISKLKNLEELSISGSLFLKRPTLQDLHDLLTPMPRITVLNLTAIPTSLEIGEILDGVLNAVPNLQVLRLGFRSTIFYTNLHVQRFLHSKLKTLHLIYSDEEPTLDLTLPTPAPVNFTLEELVIKTWRGGRLFANISPFLPNLRSLALNNANDRDLQNIFQNHKLLKNLILENNYQCSHFGYTGHCIQGISQECYSIEELKDLEFLRITKLNEALTQSETPLDFSLPNLRRLEMSIYNNYDNKKTPSDKFMRQLFDRCPKLSSIVTDNNTVPRYDSKKLEAPIGAKLISGLYHCQPSHSIPKWSVWDVHTPCYTFECENFNYHCQS